MTTKQKPINIVHVAQSFQRGAFYELHTTLSTLKQSATRGRLDRREQSLLLELAEYGLFYTSFYDRLLHHRRFFYQGKSSTEQGTDGL